MRMIVAGAVLTAALLAGSHAPAGERTIELSVPGMNCASCPYIVERAILAVEGVGTVEASLENRSATVTFDDAVTSTEAITRATADYGYPATVVEAEGS